MINDKQKLIYNLYLKAYRVNNDKPYRWKKNFKDIEDDDTIKLQLAKLEKVFIKYPCFFGETYFNAPYRIYPDDKKFFPLKFFCSQRGISTCIAYFKILTKSDPETQIEFFQESFKFIAEFCIEKGIELRDYVGYRSVSQNDCLRHLKEYKISWYTIFAIPGFYDLIHNMPRDEFELYYGSDIDIPEMLGKYQGSKKIQDLMSKMTKTISSFIQKSLQKKNNKDK